MRWMSAGRCAKKFNANIVIMYDHVSCKNFGGLHGLFEDQARERGHSSDLGTA